jgi:flagellar biosynthesis protein FliQ
MRVFYCFIGFVAGLVIGVFLAVPILGVLVLSNYSFDFVPYLLLVPLVGMVAGTLVANRFYRRMVSHPTGRFQLAQCF